MSTIFINKKSLKSIVRFIVLYNCYYHSIAIKEATMLETLQDPMFAPVIISVLLTIFIGNSKYK